MTRREDVIAVARHFQIYGDPFDATPYGSGHINDTYAVRYDQAGTIVRYVFQRVNTAIFEDTVALMDNVARVTRHVRKKLEAAGASEISRRVLTLVPSRDGQLYYQNGAGACWRVYLMIENSEAHDVLATPQQAEAVARAFGRFQEMMVDLPGPRLAEVLPGFHDARKRFDALVRAAEADACNRAADVKQEIGFVMDREDIVDVLAVLYARDEIPERITHNDAKLNNLLFDAQTGEALCVIDLDTVMPGLALYDFGDMVRTAACTASEDTPDLSSVALSRSYFEALARGYWSVAQAFLTPQEKAHLVFSGKWMTFVMGMRFLTDYLAGDTYYKIHWSTHNLDRCRTQFKLIESIEAQEEDLNRFVEQL